MKLFSKSILFAVVALASTSISIANAEELRDFVIVSETGLITMTSEEGPTFVAQICLVDRYSGARLIHKEVSISDSQNEVVLQTDVQGCVHWREKHMISSDSRYFQFAREISMKREATSWQSFWGQDGEVSKTKLNLVLDVENGTIFDPRKSPVNLEDSIKVEPLLFDQAL